MAVIFMQRRQNHEVGFLKRLSYLFVIQTAFHGDLQLRINLCRFHYVFGIISIFLWSNNPQMDSGIEV